MFWLGEFDSRTHCPISGHDATLRVLSAQEYNCVAVSHTQTQTQTDSDKFIQQKYIQVPYQVYMSFLEIQITL